MRYEVVFHSGALREFDKLSKAAQNQVSQAIDGLAVEPRPHGAVRMEGVEAYRLRAGDYRVIYAVKDDRLVVLIVKIGHRREVYRDIVTTRRRLKD